MTFPSQAPDEGDNLQFLATVAGQNEDVPASGKAKRRLTAKVICESTAFFNATWYSV